MINHPAAKAIVAALVAGLTAALVAAQTAIPMSDAAHGWVSVGLAFLGAVAVPVAVYAQPNAKDKDDNSSDLPLHMPLRGTEPDRPVP
jgi:hypothetical protein